MPLAGEEQTQSDHAAPAPRRTLVLAMLAIGALLFVLDPDVQTHHRYAIPLLVGAIALVPGIRSRVDRASDRLRSPGGRVNWTVAAILFALSARYFLFSASMAGRELLPTFHDEHMYLLQARMLAHGRLWMPPHEVGEFFESFNVIARPVYAATYFPGTALFYVPAMWTHTAPWLTSVLICGAVVAMLYLVMTKLLDGVAGLLTAPLAIALPHLRGISVMAMSHPAMLLLWLLAVFTYLRWRTRRGAGWALLLGALAGWAAITRPLDAACLLLPLGITLLWNLRGVALRRVVGQLAVMLAGAVPFLLLQLILNKGVTGSFLHTPFHEYARANFPGLTFGWSDAPAPEDSPSPLPQVRDYYRQFLRDDLLKHSRAPFFATWIRHRLAPAADVALPGRLLFILLPAGLLGLRRPPRAAVAAGALLLPLAYAYYPSYLEHYGLITAPAFLLLALAGERVLRRAFPSVGAAIVLATATLAIASLPELRGATDPFMHAPYLSDINAKLASLERTPAVVLFHYEPGRGDVHEEPVYNLTTAWPDDAAVIRAQDLGERNDRIFRYYAAREPQRFFYRYDRSTGLLTELGWAKDLVRR